MVQHTKNQTINRYVVCVADTIKKFKYPILILLFGVILMSFPKKISHSQASYEETSPDPVPENLELQLEHILEQIDGAGKTEVLLSYEFSTRSTYQIDEQCQTSTEFEEFEKQTVLTSNRNGEDLPVLIAEQYPVYRGAVVVCEGADRPTVKLNLIRAVSSATGLSSDKISVIKMRHN